MKHLNLFQSKVNNYISKNGFQDVIELIPFFDELNMPGWKSLLDTENGKPITTIIYQSEYLRILIICWNGKKQSSIHGHKDGGGLIKILEGTLEETRFDPVDKKVTGKFKYNKGSVTYIHDRIAYHRVKNPTEEMVYSLHMYTRGAQVA